jgi:hypothetical protein
MIFIFSGLPKWASPRSPSLHSEDLGRRNNAHAKAAAIPKNNPGKAHSK